MGRAIGVTRSWHGDTADTAMHCYPKLSDGGGGGHSSRLERQILHFGGQETYSPDVVRCVDLLEG